MRIALFYHSLLSCWNNGHAHYLRGYATELMQRGHQVLIYEPQNAWSHQNLLADAGPQALQPLRQKYPHLRSIPYSLDSLDLDSALEGVELVIAHEWNEPELIRALSAHRRTAPYLLLFHDTHHRAVTAPAAMRRFDLSAFDGALVYGEILREVYCKLGLITKAFVWHEAADPRIFHPLPNGHQLDDLVWIGNWGEDERAAELREFLIEPVQRLQLRASIYGVRYPDEALETLRKASIAYRGWLPNALAPEVFAHHRLTVHIPRRPYVQALPGIPTIRVFEALACGIPLICSPWPDVENLFTPGSDYLVAKNSDQMADAMTSLLESPQAARELARRGLETILKRHTVAHRVDELLAICRTMGLPAAAESTRPQQRSQEVTA